MKIYVAGVVPRPSLPRSLLSAVVELHEQFSNAADHARFHGKLKLQLPSLDQPTDQMRPAIFRQWLHEQIEAADAVLTLLVPPTVEVGIEAHLASQLGKAQTILVPSGWPVPRFLKSLDRVIGIYSHETTTPLEVLTELAAAADRRGDFLEAH